MTLNKKNLLSKGLNWRRDAFKNFCPLFSCFCSSLLKFFNNCSIFINQIFSYFHDINSEQCPRLFQWSWMRGFSLRQLETYSQCLIFSSDLHSTDLTKQSESRNLSPRGEKHIQIRRTFSTFCIFFRANIWSKFFHFRLQESLSLCSGVHHFLFSPWSHERNQEFRVDQDVL